MASLVASAAAPAAVAAPTPELPAGQRQEQQQQHLQSSAVAATLAAPWHCQFEALCAKSAESLCRRWGTLLAVVVAPLVTLGMLSVLNGQIYGSPDESGAWEALPLTAYDEGGRLLLPSCAVFNALYRRMRASCVQLGYTWSGEPGTEALAMALVAELAPSTTLQRFGSRDAMAQAIFDEPGKIDAALIIEKADASGVRYSLWTNNTADTWYSITSGDDYHYAKVQAVLEESMLRTGLGTVTPAPRAGRILAQLKRVPGLTLAGDGAGAVKGGLNIFVDVMGGTLAVFGLTASAVLTMQLVIQEKVSGLLGMLRMAGLRESAFWCSWFLMLSVVQLVSAFLLSIAGLASGVELFSECNFLVHFLAAFFFSTALSSLSLAAAAAVRRPVTAHAVQFALVLFNVLWQMNVASPWAREASYKYPPKDFWNVRALTNPNCSPIWKVLLFLMPVFHYGLSLLVPRGVPVNQISLLQS